MQNSSEVFKSNFAFPEPYLNLKYVNLNVTKSNRILAY